MEKALLAFAQIARGRMHGAIVAALAMLGAANIAFGAPDAAAQERSIFDDWATPGLGAVVRLEPCTESPRQLCGRLLWVWDPRSFTHGAPGMMMLRGFSWDGTAWRGGVLTNPEDGRAYRGAITPDGSALRLRGCAGPFCREQVWRRLSSIPRPA